ncbi:unnamed protein product [Heligmosomoides polygyrus]|uniref:Secreted protein n=1 Tax=Heligmosomoides polygyrus TaxID=6339 RepID=A0A183GNB2_HELPZ|nr:unnamed protein product [Heligmosomoides polygyrus]
MRIPIFLFFFHNFQLFAFVNFKLTCTKVLEYAGHPFFFDFCPQGSLSKGGPHFSVSWLDTTRASAELLVLGFGKP